jgi:hypothetical protein
MRRHVILAVALVSLIGLTGLTACASGSEDLASGSTPPTADSATSATPTTGAPSTSGASPTTSAAPTMANTIPEAYRGHWNTRLADCPGDSGEGRLIVEARAMTFHESVGRVVAVTPKSDRISVTLKLSGEGQTWQDTRTWRLSPDGATLTDVTNGATRSRCP